jgi:hypothetical protein
MIGDIHIDHQALTDEATIKVVIAIETKEVAPISRKNSGRNTSAKRIGVHHENANSC